MKSLIFALALVVGLAGSSQAGILDRVLGPAPQPQRHYRPAPKPQPAPQPKPAPVEEIRGTAPPIDDSATVHVVLCLPKNYKASDYCQRLRQALERPADSRLKQIHPHVNVVVMSPDDPRFTHSWQKYAPEVNQGKPVIVMQQGSQLLGKQTEPKLAELGIQVEAWFGKRKCPNGICPQPEPAPAPEPAPEPEPVPLPDTDVVVDAKSEPNVALMILLAAAAGGATWLAMFKRGQ